MSPGMDFPQQACWNAVMPYEPPPDLATLNLAQITELVAARKLPPVENWQPAHRGDSEMRILADGRWLHQGGEITRPAMVRAFSSLLRKDDDGFWLVTPHEKLSIIVEDAPFIAVEVESSGNGKERMLAFRLNTDDLVIAGSTHPIELRPLPYLHVRHGLWAKIARPAYYALAEWALAEGNTQPGVWSDGQFFALGTAG
jgi:uncharacterized protein